MPINKGQCRPTTGRQPERPTASSLGTRRTSRAGARLGSALDDKGKITSRGPAAGGVSCRDLDAHLLPVYLLYLPIQRLNESTRPTQSARLLKHQNCAAPSNSCSRRLKTDEGVLKESRLRHSFGARSDAYARGCIPDFGRWRQHSERPDLWSHRHPAAFRHACTRAETGMSLSSNPSAAPGCQEHKTPLTKRASPLQRRRSPGELCSDLISPFQGLGQEFCTNKRSRVPSHQPPLWGCVDDDSQGRQSFVAT